MLPSDTTAALEEAARAEALASLSRAWFLQRLLRELNRLEIPVILLKGADFAYRLYPDPSLRPMRDLDVLIPSSRMEAAEGVLEELDYRLVTRYRTWYLEEHYHLRFHRESGGPPVELHWHLHESDCAFRIPIDDLWARARTDDGVITGACYLELEDSFLFACLHIAKHRMLAGLLPYVDLLTLLRRRSGELRWPVVLERAEQWGGLRSLSLVLAILKRLFPRVRVPAEGLPGLEQVVVEAALRQTLESDPAGHRRRTLVSRWRVLERRRRAGPALPPEEGVVPSEFRRPLAERGGAYLRDLWQLLRDPEKRTRARDDRLLENWLSRPGDF